MAENNHTHDWNLISQAENIIAECGCGRHLTVEQVENVLNLNYLDLSGKQSRGLLEDAEEALGWNETMHDEIAEVRDRINKALKV